VSDKGVFKPRFASPDGPQSHKTQPRQALTIVILRGIRAATPALLGYPSSLAFDDQLLGYSCQ